MFENRRLLIATKHKKESVLTPLLEKGLGVRCFVAANYDTDVFGTFTGEVERKEGPLNTVRNKCLEAMKLYGCDLAVASEGSFGSHPFVPFAPANEEFVIFIDQTNDFEITGRYLEIETNFSQEEITNWKELVDFANRAKFPSHALILRNANKAVKTSFKGLTDWHLLKASYREFVKEGQAVQVETDMRALYNPTRMKAIEKAGQNLLEKIRLCCPKCDSPGFSVGAAKPGLLCRLCGTKTRSTLSYCYECQKCSFKKEEKFPHGKFWEDPMYCDRCNP